MRLTKAQRDVLASIPASDMPIRCHFPTSYPTARELEEIGLVERRVHSHSVSCRRTPAGDAAVREMEGKRGV